MSTKKRAWGGVWSIFEGTRTSHTVKYEAFIKKLSFTFCFKPFYFFSFPKSEDPYLYVGFVRTFRKCKIKKTKKLNIRFKAKCLDKSFIFHSVWGPGTFKNTSDPSPSPSFSTYVPDRLNFLAATEKNRKTFFIFHLTLSTFLIHTNLPY